MTPLGGKGVERIDSGSCPAYTHRLRNTRKFWPYSARPNLSAAVQRPVMKVRSSLKSLKGRHRDCKMVRRKGVIYIINKTDPRFKAKQG